MRDILEYFPLPTPRPGQVQALNYVQDVTAKGFRDIVLECPTGTGKTALAATIAAWSRDNLDIDKKFQPGGYILVQQKVLQDQIEAELNRLGSQTPAALIKASIEYDCPQFKRCSVGMMDRRCPQISLGACSYKQAKGRFLTAPIAVTNYAYFFTERRYVGQVEARHVLILDESHNLSNTLLAQADLVVSGEKLSQFAPDLSEGELGGIRTLDDFLTWLEDDYLPSVEAQAEILAALCEEDEGAREFNDISSHLLKIGAFMERALADRKGWVFWSEENRDHITLTARPLDAAPYFHELVGTQSALRVYLSAYPGPKSIFCRELGLDPTRTAWMKQGSPFAPESRAVHLLGIGSMARKSQEATLPAAVRCLVKLAETYPDRGLVHTHSYKLAEAAVAALQRAGLGDRVVYPKQADQRDEALARHAKQPGAILISPSVGEGFDFRGDLARWQVVLKCPFGSLGSLHTVAKMERDPAWYQAETVKHLLQMCGRICRSSDDFGATYILDSDVDRVLREAGSYLPKWFKAAVLDAEGAPFFVD
jgi:Rad3-related DNA helicase